MYLKAIELHGFKSFPDKTRITFEKGMSAVVGPNGSGKSNISDAIRWVLGETRSRELRGSGKMEDIIFGGTQKRSAMGFASVSLILDNSEKAFDLDSDEISVTRKYYRGGDSEYQINSNKVRLKDIYELFLDTGLGRSGYSIVGQGKISEIVTAKPENRREIFEEASGISKFRYKKNEAEKSLNNAQENITRLLDILLNLEERVEPLRKDSEKANRFLELSKEKKEMEISLWIDTTEKSKDLLRVEERNLEIFKSDYDEIDSKLSDKEKYIEEKFFYSNSLLQKSDENMNEIRSTESEISSLNSQKAVLETKISYTNDSILNLNNQLENLNNQDGDFENQKNIKLDEIKKIQADIDENELEKKQVEEKLLSINEKAQNQDKEKADILENINLYNEKIQDYKIEFHSLKTQNEALNEGFIKAKAQKKEAEDFLETVNGQVLDFSSFIETANDEITKNKNMKQGIELKLSRINERLNEISAVIQKNEIEENNTKSRIKLLEDMENSFDGFQHSVKNILTRAKNGQLAGIEGSVSQLISVEKGYETAIEIALGYALQNIVVENETHAKRGIEFLKQTKGGRATFLPIDTIRPSNFNEVLPEGARLASSVIKTKDKYKNIISSLLGRTIITKDINAASSLSKKLNFRYRIVTIDGQQVNVGGSFTGGSVSKSAGLFSRKGEIEKLKESLIDFKNKLLESEELKRKTRDEFDLLTAQIDGYDAEINTLLEEKTNAEIEYARHAQQKNQYEAAIKIQEDILENSNKAIENNNLKSNEIEEEIKKYSNLLEEININLEDTLKFDDELVLNQRNLNETLQEIKFNIIKYQSDIEIVKNSIMQIENSANDKKIQRDNLLNEINLLNEEVLKNNESTENILLEIDKLKEEILKKEEENKEITKTRFEIEKERNQITSDNKQLFNQKEDLSKQIVKLDEKIKSMQISYDDIVSKLWEEYEMTILTAKEIAVEVENPNQMKKDLAAVKANIKKLGDVNVGAIVEYKEVYEKYTFLKEQLADLEESKNQLTKLIASLNGEMKILFSESFEIINRNFQNIFVELFGGGRASLKLTDPENVLESGVEIEVSPPGKVIKNLTSLSGGEQALVAISVYFGILAHNPSPFCILDEIEAALDDVNVSRYANYLHRISNKTQFIVITHRRGTMEAADVLYGVTMQEDGISKLLKLDVNNLNTDILN